MRVMWGWGRRRGRLAGRVAMPAVAPISRFDGGRRAGRRSATQWVPMLADHSLVECVVLNSLRRRGEVRAVPAISYGVAFPPEMCNAAPLILGDLHPGLASGSADD